MKLRPDEYMPGMAAIVGGDARCVYRKTRAGWESEGSVRKIPRNPRGEWELEPDLDDDATRLLLPTAKAKAQAARHEAGEEVLCVGYIAIPDEDCLECDGDGWVEAGCGGHLGVDTLTPCSTCSDSEDGEP